ncbi:MAG: thermonuclease family protein [Cyanobacteria bacterium J06638_20]
MHLLPSRIWGVLWIALLAGILLTQMPFIHLSAADENSGEFQVQVAAIKSGQTIEVLEAGSTLRTAVRLIGIEAPDPRQLPWGEAATQALQAKLAGQTVRLEFDQEQEDAYGRTLAYVWLGDRLINEAMVEEGWVLAKGRSPRTDIGNTRYALRLANAQETARLLHRGIWNPAQPMRQRPSDFRRNLE